MCSKLPETCTKICRKLLLLHVALVPLGAQRESRTSWAWMVAAAQPLQLRRGANSRQPGESCHFGKSGASWNVLLGIHVLRGRRKPWLLTSELKRTDLCQQKALGSGCDLLPGALRHLPRPLPKYPVVLFLAGCSAKERGCRAQDLISDTIVENECISE